MPAPQIHPTLPRVRAHAVTPDHQGAFGHELAALTQEELAALLASSAVKVAILPLGSTGPHGPHLRLDTPCLLAEEVARRAATELADDGFEAVWFPTLAFGAPDTMQHLPGAAAIPGELLTQLVRETALAAHRMGFDRILALTLHTAPAQLDAVREAARSFRDATGEPMAFLDPADPRFADDLPVGLRTGEDHGGEITTSLMLAAHPEGVVVERAAELPAVGLDQGPGAGYRGNPSGASLGEGMELLDHLAALAFRAVHDSLA